MVVLNEIGESGVRGREVSGECSHESLSGGSEVGTAEEEMVVIRDGEMTEGADAVLCRGADDQAHAEM